MSTPAGPAEPDPSGRSGPQRRPWRAALPSGAALRVGVPLAMAVVLGVAVWLQGRPFGADDAPAAGIGRPTESASGTLRHRGDGGRAASRPPTRSVLVAAVGDIACDPASSAFRDGAGEAGRCRQQDVADLVARRDPAAFLALGDIQYEDGTLAAFRTSYDRAFGRLLPVTRAVVGNHEYHTPEAAGFWDYFGDRGGPRGKGWYSFDLGGWHVVALNSNCREVSCEAGSEQERWLRADLAAHPTSCTLAMWHHPRWSSGSEHGDNTGVDPLVRALHDHHVDVVLSGHDHDYERFAPQDPDGRAAPGRGVRQFVVGTGGKNRYSVRGKANTETKDDTSFGALFLTLGATSYTWQYESAVGSYSDAGTTVCH